MTQTIAADDFRTPHEHLVLYLTYAAIAVFVLLTSETAIIPITIGILVIIGYVSRKSAYGTLLRTSPRATEKQFPRVHKITRLAAARLCMNPAEVFIAHNKSVNAFAMGDAARGMVIINTSLLHLFNDEELLFVVGHEQSHIKCGHTAKIFREDHASTIMRSWVFLILRFAFRFYSRCCEYTCDRGGLLACRDVRAARSALLKLLAGSHAHEVDMDELLRQVEEWEGSDPITEWSGRLSQLLSTHPDIIDRILKLERFAQSRLYKSLIDESDEFAPAGDPWRARSAT